MCLSVTLPDTGSGAPSTVLHMIGMRSGITFTVFYPFCTYLAAVLRPPRPA
jgi:hypothetical protein